MFFLSSTFLPYLLLVERSTDVFIVFGVEGEKEIFAMLITVEM